MTKGRFPPPGDSRRWFTIVGVETGLKRLYFRSFFWRLETFKSDSMTKFFISYKLLFFDYGRSFSFLFRRSLLMVSEDAEVPIKSFDFLDENDDIFM